jgi:hypothetical protein
MATTIELWTLNKAMVQYLTVIPLGRGILFSAFMEPKYSSLYSEKPTTEPCLAPNIFTFYFSRVHFSTGAGIAQSVKQLGLIPNSTNVKDEDLHP